MLLQRTTALNIVLQRIAGVFLLCDISQGRPRPAVPACHRRQVFATIHEVAHQGVRATRRLISRRFAWKGMPPDMVAWTKDFAWRDARDSSMAMLRIGGDGGAPLLFRFDGINSSWM
jgi:hypothetical protein